MFHIYSTLYLGDYASLRDADPDMVILSLCPVLEKDKRPEGHIILETEDDPTPSDALVNEYRRILETAFPIIRDALADGRRVLVHCGAGRQRSAGVVAYYLAKTRFASKGSSAMEEAIFHVMNKSTVAFREKDGSNNVHFERALF